MCVLYSFKKSAEETRALFAYLDEPDFPPRAVITPGSPVAIIRKVQGERRFDLVRWGLVPSWVKEIQPGKPLVNARGETVLEKPSFRNAMRRRRCLIPADGFYEWKGDIPGRKQQDLVHRPDNSLFAFAGLWEHWLGADGSELESAAIVTTAANAMIGEFNDRMPVVIDPENFAAWLDSDNVGAAEAATLLVAKPDDYFLSQPVVLERRPRAKPVEQPRLL